MINAPITDLKTIQECLRCSQEGSTEAGQEYTISTFNLGVCMKAYPMIWSEPEKYKSHIILIGTFHCCEAYLKCVGKIYCLGWTEVALKAKLITTGSMSGDIKGKNGLCTHKSPCWRPLREDELGFRALCRIKLLPVTCFGLPVTCFGGHVDVNC